MSLSGGIVFNFITRLTASMLALITTFFSTLFGVSEKPIWPGTELVPRKPMSYAEIFQLKDYDLVVDPVNGDDANDLIAPVQYQTKGPLKTVTEAKDRLIALKQRLGGNYDKKIVVWLRGGVYSLKDTLVFNSDDMENVVYKAYPGELPIFDPSVELTGFSAETVNGVTVWTTTVDPTLIGNFNTLCKDGEALPVTRYPESGYLNVSSVDTSDAMYTEDTTPWSLTLGQLSFNADPADLLDFKNFSDVNVRILHYWTEEHSNIASLDLSTGKVGISRPSSMRISAGDRYYFENVFEALDKPGEWYFDSVAGKLYYVPQKGDSLGSLVLRASTLDKLVTIDGVNDISFKGIAFRNAAWSYPTEGGMAPGMDFPQAAISVDACIDVKNANNISITYCRFLNIGNSAVRYGVNVKDSEVKVCIFDNIGANAVVVRGENVQLDDPTITKDISIFDNHICHYGRKYSGAIGVLVVHANTVDVSYNTIHDGYYTAISVGWVWGYAYNVTDNVTVCNNLIYNIGQGALSDMGGIYTLGVQPNTVISGNTIHDVRASSDSAGYGGWGIYLDEGSSYITVEKNLVYDCGSQSFHQHYGKENILRNNIFAFGDEGQLRVSRAEEHTSLYLLNNIFIGEDEAMYAGVVEDVFEDDANLYWDYENHKITMSSKDSNGSLSICSRLYRINMKYMGYYNNAVYKDPWFRDALGRDFTLATNSPAMTFGFEYWDVNVAGTLTDFSRFIDCA